MTDKRTLIIFGATGDLASRLLLPGLGTFLQSGRAVPVQLIGTGRSERSPEKWKDIVTQSFASQDVKGPEVDATIESTQFIQGDPTDPKHLEALLAAADSEPILYFALPPQIASDICEALEHVELPLAQLRSGLGRRDLTDGETGEHRTDGGDDGADRGGLREVVEVRDLGDLGAQTGEP